MSLENEDIALIISSCRFIYLLRNLGLNSFVIPIKSCNTRTCPSTLLPAPIPMIGILTSFATFLAKSLGIFSRTIAKHPIFSKSLASLIN